VGRKRQPTHLQANRVLKTYQFSCKYFRLLFLPGYKKVKTLVPMFRSQ